MIRPITFLDTRQATARYVLTYEKQLRDGVLQLRDVNEDGKVEDLPILKEWNSARALLARIKTGASELNGGKTLTLGKAWIEQLPGGHGTPWRIEDDEYAQGHVRTRTCLIPAPNCFTYSGMAVDQLGVGIVNVVEHRILHADTNFSTYPRVHLIVDVKRAEPDAE